jgi:hypothetical protein
MAERKGLAGRVAERIGAAAKAVAKGVVAGLADEVIPRGADEFAQAMFTGRSGLVGPSPSPPEQVGVHGPETAERKAEVVIDFQEAKEALRTERAIDKEVSKMGPEEQKIAANFREAPSPHPLEKARQRAREIEPGKGRELDL